MQAASGRNETELKETRAQIIGLCNSHRLANLLFASIEIGLYDRIPEGGATVEEIATACSLDPTAARVLMQSLAATGLLYRDGSRYWVPSSCAAFLRAGEQSLIPHIRLLHEESGYWLRAAEILRPSYECPLLGDVQFRSDVVSAYMDLVEWNNRAYASMLWDRLADLTPGLRRILDVGPGFGYFSSALLERNQEVEVTFYDLENALERCRRRHEGQPYANRICWECGQAPALPFEGQFDVVMANDLLHYFDNPEKLVFLRAAHKALKPQGRFIVVKFRLDDTGCAPQNAAIFSFKMFLTTHKSHLETDAELEVLAREAGFHSVERIPLDEMKTLVTGVR
jgi:SAM-dependent methyltransferase